MEVEVDVEEMGVGGKVDVDVDGNGEVGRGEEGWERRRGGGVYELVRRKFEIMLSIMII